MKLKDFKNEFRLMCSDTLGDALDCWFEAAGQMCTRWMDIPKEWQYKAGLSPLEPDNYFHDIFNNCNDEEIISIGNLLYRYLRYIKFKEWQPIATAPKSGETIEIKYEDGITCLAFWSERPVCMAGATVYNKPSWATAGEKVDKNLPLDEPKFWKEI